MTTWNDMAPFIALHAADCPTFTIAQEVQLAATEFFTDTRVWRSADRITLGTTVAGQAAYTVAPPTDLAIIGIPVAWLDDEEIDEALQRDRGDVAPDETATFSSQIKVLVSADDQVILLPAPYLAGQVLRGTLAYAPAATAPGIDDAMWLKYRETIRELTLAKLKGMQGKPWSDPAGAQMNQGKYDQKALEDSTAAGPRRRNRLRTRALRF